jgi:hypothetical protein
MAKTKIEKYVELRKELETEIAMKIFNGQRLTKEEFEIVKGAKIYDQRLTFESLDSTFYDSPTKQGWLCLDKKTGKIKSGISKVKMNPDGSKTEVICIWGIHREDIQPEFLRPEQKKYW